MMTTQSKSLLACGKALYLAGAFAFISGCLPPGGPAAPIEGPIAGTPVNLASTMFKLSDVGYEQSEYFIAGTASSYSGPSPRPVDGKWAVEVADEADYKTRILVARPADPTKFNGTVIFEWMNVSSGIESPPEWLLVHTELTRKGYAWVGISAQKAGIDGGGWQLLGASLHLKALNPVRYRSLVHPGDQYSYDIFTQAAQAVIEPGSINPLGDLSVQYAIAVGESQSADFLLTYVNAIAPIANLFDGYLVHSRFHGSADLAPTSLTAASEFASRPLPVHVRDDLNVPVMMVQTESDLTVLQSIKGDSQPDSENFRLWEVAGTGHANWYVSHVGLLSRVEGVEAASVVETTSSSPIPFFLPCDKPINSGPHHFVSKAAIAALDNWVRTGVPPAHADRLTVAGDPATLVRDSLGNAVGGIRTPYVDVPIATLSGEGQTGSFHCQLFGTTRLFDKTQLASLYPNHEVYEAAVNASVDTGVGQGFVLPEDGELIKSWARDSDIGN